MMDGEDLPVSSQASQVCRCLYGCILTDCLLAQGPERELPVPGPPAAGGPAPAPTPTGAPVAPVARDTGALLESFLLDR